MDTARKLEYLKQVELFSSLGTEELHLVVDKIIVRQFKKNDIILFKGDTNNYIYIIFDGEVKVSQSTEDGKEVILFIHQAGEIFGETFLVDRGNSPALISATEDTLCAVISKKDFYHILSNQSDILERLHQTQCRRGFLLKVSEGGNVNPSTGAGNEGSKGGECNYIKTLGGNNKFPEAPCSAALNILTFFIPFIWLAIRKVVFSKTIGYVKRGNYNYQNYKKRSAITGGVKC